MTLSIMILIIKTLSIPTLRIIRGLFATFSIKTHNYDAECRILFIVMLNVTTPSVVMPNVIIPSVVAPLKPKFNLSKIDEFLNFEFDQI
jgi:hypothetical protein